MKKTLLFLLAILLFSAFSFPKKKREIKCSRQTGQFMLNDKTGFRVDAMMYDAKTGFAYALRNDGRNLYVVLKMLHTDVQRKALLTGFTLWVDPNGKGKHVLGVEYPQRHVHGKRPQSHRFPSKERMQKQGSYRPTQEQLHRFNERLAAEHPVFKGFDQPSKKDSTRGTPPDIRVRAQLDSLGHLLYKAVIPLSAVFVHPKDYLTAEKPFSVIFETGYLQMDMSRMQGHGPGGGRGGGMRSGQPHPQRMAFMQSMAEPSRLRLKSVFLYPLK